jgi:hypothetical protein
MKPGHQTTGNTCVIWSDESSFTLFHASCRDYVWRTLKEAYKPECLFPSVKHGLGSVVAWAAVSWCSILLVPLVPFTAESLQGSTWTSGVIRCNLWSRYYFQTVMQFTETIMIPFTQLELFSHSLKIMKRNFSILLGRHNHEAWTSLNHSGQFWRLDWGPVSHLQHL